MNPTATAPNATAPNATAPNATVPNAALLDAADPLASLLEHFTGQEDGVIAYLDGNSLGRPLRSTAATLTEFVENSWGARLIRGWDEQWLNEPFTVGDRLGEVALGAAAGQVFIGDSTSVLIYKLIRAAIAFQPERTEVIIDRDNFPTDRYILEGIAQECGITLRWVQADPATGVETADLETVLGPKTALVVLSHVAYRSGHLADAAALTAQIHAAGALVLWDLCHSAGSVPVELDAWGVDIAVGCSYKYLNGGPGAPAFGYVRHELQNLLQQPIWGWIGADQPFLMGPAYRPADGIRRFITGTPPVLAMQPMKGMIELIAEAGIDRVRAKSVALTEFAIALVDDQLIPLGATLSSPRDPAKRGSHVIVDHPHFQQVTAMLWERGVIPDFRPPTGLRIGLSPLSSSFAEVERGINAVTACLRELG